LISSFLVTIAVLAPLAFVVVALTAEFAKAAQHLPAQISAALDPNAPVTGRIVGWLERYVDVQSLRSGQFLVDQLKGMGSAIVGQSIGVLGGAIGIIVKTFFVIFTMYYLFRDGDLIVKALPEFLPLKKEQSKQIFERTGQVISASIYGVVFIAMLQGVLGGLAFWVLGLPSPVLWGVVMAFVCMIPVAGSFLVWLPASIYLALTGHWTRATLLTIWGILIISTIDNFIRPKLIGGRTRLHELFVFFAVLGGLRVFGVLGIVLGPVVLAITLALLDTLRHAGAAEEV
ncbi:MAG TPA: AI-2E family transporter, partial [Pyrinomonadaceae bacterium]